VAEGVGRPSEEADWPEVAECWASTALKDVVGGAFVSVGCWAENEGPKSASKALGLGAEAMKPPGDMVPASLGAPWLLKKGFVPAPVDNAGLMTEDVG